MAKKSGVTFPGESARYRQARNALLTAEIELRRHVEQVARLRRKLPLGGEVAEDYVFMEGRLGSEVVRPVNLRELFSEGKDTLLIYNFMFGPNMKQACPMCTSFIDSLNGAAPHVSQRANLVIVAKSPIQRLVAFASGREWNKLRLLSSAENGYNLDYHGETADGGQMPVINVFVRRRGKIYHFYNTELCFGKADRGQNQRHIDMLWPLWNLLDLTPEGRGADWYPSLSY